MWIQEILGQSIVKNVDSNLKLLPNDSQGKDRETCPRLSVNWYSYYTIDAWFAENKVPDKRD